MVLLYPFIALSTSGAIRRSYRSGVLDGCCNSASSHQLLSTNGERQLTKVVSILFLSSSFSSSFDHIGMFVGKSQRGRGEFIGGMYE